MQNDVRVKRLRERVLELVAAVADPTKTDEVYRGFLKMGRAAAQPLLVCEHGADTVRPAGSDVRRRLQEAPGHGLSGAPR